MEAAGVGAYFLGSLIAAIGGIMILVAAFRESIGWGLGSLFVPFVSWIYVFTHWYEAKKGVSVWFLGVIVMATGIFLVVNSGGGSPFMPFAGRDGDSVPIAIPEAARGFTDRIMERMPTNTTEEAGAVGYVGRPMRDVRDELGPPKGEMEHSGMVFWYYEDITLVSKDGGKTVTTVQRKGGPDTTQTKPRPVKVTTTGKRPDDVKVISGGQSVSLKQVLVPGRVTIVDFYADWCGPCRQMDPNLKALAKKNSKVVLRKIDIVKWHSPVARQHGIERIPYVGVFAPDGRQVGRYTSSFAEVVQLVNEAQRR